MKNSIARNFNFFSLLQFAFPTMIMMVFMSLYTIVDGIFISRLVGTDVLSFHVKWAYGDFDSAREDFSFIILTGLIAGFLLMVIGNICLPAVRRISASSSN